MTYFVDVFSVATYEEFSCTDKAQAGFHPRAPAATHLTFPDHK